MTGPIYLDHNASTPIDPAVIDRICWAMQTFVGNASSVDHAFGHAAHAAIEEARGTIADHLGARASDLVFTSGATEANNIAVRGAFRAAKAEGRTRVVTASTEHPSVLETVRSLEAEGAQVVVLPVDENGQIDLNELAQTLSAQTALVTIMAANNETGVIHPVADIAALCVRASVPFHSDMTQYAAHMPVNLATVGVTLASFSGHKLYGPKGVGVLFARSRRPRARLDTIWTGGGQERGTRPGTLNTEGILGLAEAVVQVRQWLKDPDELEAMKAALEARLATISGLRMNGLKACRLPNTLNVSIEGIDPLALQHRLRERLVFSTGSACSTEKVQASPVLTAMFGECERARNGFRLGLGRGTTWEEVEQAAVLIHEAVGHLRNGAIGLAQTTSAVL